MMAKGYFQSYSFFLLSAVFKVLESIEKITRTFAENNASTLACGQNISTPITTEMVGSYVDCHIGTNPYPPNNESDAAILVVNTYVAGAKDNPEFDECNHSDQIEKQAKNRNETDSNLSV